MNEARDAARRLIREGLCPVPIPNREKGPRVAGWQNLRIREDEVDRFFIENANIGVILGAPSRNLQDVDLDCDEALRLADDLLPATGRVHGRAGRPRSHRFYLGDEPGRLVPFKDPVTKQMLVELRGDGGQTLIPPSVHPSGEGLEWVDLREPASVLLADLKRLVARLAAACLLVRYYPGGTRHEFTLALAGFLLRHGFTESDATELLLVVAQAVGPSASRHEDLAHIRGNVRDTAERVRGGKSAVGGRTLKEYLDPKIITKLIEWLGLDLVSGAAAPAAAELTLAATEGVHERVDDPHRIGRLLLERCYRHPDRPRLVFHSDEFLGWTGTRYEVTAESALRGEIAREAKAFFDEKNVEAVRAWEANGGVDPETGKSVKKPTCKTVTMTLAGNVRQALTGIVGTPSAVVAPAWLDEPQEDRPASEIVSFRNGLVHVTKYLADGKDYEIPHTPRFFTVNAMDFVFDPSAPQPKAWLAFLHDLWPRSDDSIRELQKWFGYALTADTSQQKILALIGPPRSGKGTIVRVLIALVGAANVAGPTLSSFATNFGLWPLLGKRLAVISDARITGRTDAAPVVERLLSISGEDSLTVDRKNLPPVTMKLGARLMLLSNELPRLGDSSAALSSRMVILGLTRSWLGCEDPRLTDRLLAELPGILLHFALPGLQMLKKDGHFRQPTSGQELVEELEALSSPVLAFVRDRCVEEAGANVEVPVLFDEWRKWCEQIHRENAGDAQAFGRNLRAAIPHLTVDRPRRSGERVRVYEGIRLRRPGEEWSAMVRGPFYSTRGGDEERSSISIEPAIERTADQRGPEHPCVGCGCETSEDVLYCAPCWDARPTKPEVTQ